MKDQVTEVDHLNTIRLTDDEVILLDKALVVLEDLCRFHDAGQIFELLWMKALTAEVRNEFKTREGWI
ncbi:hypothetical protein [Pseudooceanicola sp. LIPI14-2-Ac024]|uniref:hypothetical protein n=1 Tax=Pseudooceanicola sp. LIPI14-2-Ac024 TaxID=3344875 RepID=UPI0035CF648E